MLHQLFQSILQAHGAPAPKLDNPPMSREKLDAVQKVLTENAGLAAWYQDEHEVYADCFTVQNVREYGLDGKGELADQIIADGIKEGTIPQ